MPDQPAEFKLTKDPSGPTRRYIFPDRPSWPQLSAKIATLFDLDQSAVALSYVDGDGDVIILNSDDELQQYYTEIGLQRTIKFNVRSLAQDKPAARVEQAIASSSSLSNDASTPSTTAGNAQLDWAREELLRSSVNNTEAGNKIMSAFEGMLGAMRGPPPRPPPHRHGYWPRRHHHHHFGGWGPPPPPPWAHGPPGPHHGPPPFPPPPFGPPMGHYHHHDMYRPPRSPSPPPSLGSSPEDEPIEEATGTDASARRHSDDDEHGRSPGRQHHRRPSSPELPSGSSQPPPPYPRHEGWVGYASSAPGPRNHWY